MALKFNKDGSLDKRSQLEVIEILRKELNEDRKFWGNESRLARFFICPDMFRLTDVRVHQFPLLYNTITKYRMGKTFGAIYESNYWPEHDHWTIREKLLNEVEEQIKNKC